MYIHRRDPQVMKGTNHVYFLGPHKEHMTNTLDNILYDADMQ